MRTPNGDDLGIAFLIVWGLAPFAAAGALIVWVIRKAMS